jgi:hypothetical protein
MSRRLVGAENGGGNVLYQSCALQQFANEGVGGTAILAVNSHERDARATIHAIKN